MHTAAAHGPPPRAHVRGPAERTDSNAGGWKILRFDACWVVEAPRDCGVCVCTGAAGTGTGGCRSRLPAFCIARACACERARQPSAWCAHAWSARRGRSVERGVNLHASWSHAQALATVRASADMARPLRLSVRWGRCSYYATTNLTMKGVLYSCTAMTSTGAAMDGSPP